jgi:hypothetical protein
MIARSVMGMPLIYGLVKLCRASLEALEALEGARALEALEALEGARALEALEALEALGR